MDDILEQLERLPGSGYSHNNLRPSNIHVDAFSHSHLSDIVAAAV